MLFSRKLLSISTDRSLFTSGSAVQKRLTGYATDWEEMHVIVFAGPEFSEQVIAPNCWVYSTASRTKWMYPFDAIRLGRFIAKRRQVTHITCQDPFLTAMTGVSLKREFKIPLEIQIHTDIGSPFFTYSFGNKVRKMLAGLYIPKADTIRVVSQRIKKYLVESLHIADSKITVRPIVVDVETVKNALITVDIHKKYPQFRKIALMASRLEKEKNIELAIHSWPEVIKNVSEAGLVIVGSGSEEGKLKLLVRRLGLSDSVTFESWTDKNTLVSYYKTADIFLNTSWYEGYGLTLVEADAAGCPVISTDVGITPELRGIHIIPVNDKQRLVEEVVAAFKEGKNI